LWFAVVLELEIVLLQIVNGFAVFVPHHHANGHKVYP